MFMMYSHESGEEKRQLTNEFLKIKLCYKTKVLGHSIKRSHKSFRSKK